MIFSLRRQPAWFEKLGRPTGRGVRVGMIGTGYDNDDPNPRVLPGLGFVDPSDDFAVLRTVDDHDRIGHGTDAARLILRMAPDARVVPIRIYGEGLESSGGTLHGALGWAVEEKLDVVCIEASLIQELIKPIYVACEKARRSGIILVCGANPRKDMDCPAAFEPVIGVLQGRFDSPYEFRYHADARYEVEGWGEPVDVPEKVSGQLYAAPTVAGIVALLRERHPGATLEDIRQLLQQFSVR